MFSRSFMWGQEQEINMKISKTTTEKENKVVQNETHQSREKGKQFKGKNTIGDSRVRKTNLFLHQRKQEHAFIVVR